MDRRTGGFVLRMAWVALYSYRQVKSSFIDVTKRFQNQGFITRSTMDIPGKPITKAVLRHYDSGKVRGVILQGGQTLAIINGTWQINDNTLVVRSNVATVIGDYRQTTTSILVSKQRLSSISIATNNIRTVSTARKK